MNGVQLLKRLGSALEYFSCILAFVSLVIGCSTSHVWREGNISAQILPDSGVVFLLDPDSSVWSVCLPIDVVVEFETISNFRVRKIMF